MRIRRRWGRVDQIKHVRRIFDKKGGLTPEFKDLPNKLKHLSAWRGMHVVRKHTAVHSYGSRQGFLPSSNLPLRKKLAFVRKRTVR